jgi:Fur family ferric uptake transcriptional regulator
VTDKDLRGVGLKVTLPRLKILKILENSVPHHLRAEDIYRLLVEQGEDVGLATVYRVLTQFEASGLVKRHNFESDHSVFELDHGGHHDHLVCMQCGKVEEFFDELIEKQQIKIAKKSGFNITHHSHTVYGVCEECQKIQ